MLSLRNIASLLSVALFVLQGAQLFGQDTLRYSGEFKAGPYRGEADFIFRLQENDTVLDGPFQFQRSNLEALLQKEDRAFNFIGRFENNTAEGPWNFLFGEYQTDSRSELVDNQYRVSISGVQHRASGELRSGKPHGRWNYEVDRLERSETVARLFGSSIEYENGVPQKSFRIENSEYTLIGRSLRNGLAHDEWTLFSNDGNGTSESWTFNNGLLQQVKAESDGRQEAYEFFSSISGEGVTIALNDAYLNLLQLKQKLRYPEASLPGNLTALLNENQTYYRKIDQILSDLGESDFAPGFKVVVEHFPLDSVETKQLASIREFYMQSNWISASLLEDTQMNILKLSDEQASYLYATLEAFETEYLEPLEALVTYSDLGVMEYISRDDILKILWPAGMPDTELTVEAGEESAAGTFKGPRADAFNFEARNLESVHQMAEYVSISLDSIQEVLSKKLTLEKRQQDLVQLEEKLIARSDHIHTQVDSLHATSSASVKKALESIKNLTAEQLSVYSNIEDDETKLDRGRELLECYKVLDQLVSAIGLLPAQGEEIRILYEDAVWNPFMAVIMTEEVKKRITAAYRKYALPYLLTRTERELQCENAGELNELFRKLYQRMIEMREEDTSRLERKLKREQDPAEILDLFDVEPKEREEE